MARRKTVSIRELVVAVNYRNRNSTCDPKVREGWNSLLEAILMDTSNYRGFGYLKADEVPEGQQPGIELSDGKAMPVFPDETRRFYYYKE